MWVEWDVVGTTSIAASTFIFSQLINKTDGTVGVLYVARARFFLQGSSAGVGSIANFGTSVTNTGVGSGLVNYFTPYNQSGTDNVPGTLPLFLIPVPAAGVYLYEKITATGAAVAFGFSGGGYLE